MSAALVFNRVYTASLTGGGVEGCLDLSFWVYLRGLGFVVGVNKVKWIVGGLCVAVLSCEVLRVPFSLQDV